MCPISPLNIFLKTIQTRRENYSKVGHFVSFWLLNSRSDLHCSLSALRSPSTRAVDCPPSNATCRPRQLTTIPTSKIRHGHCTTARPPQQEEDPHRVLANSRTWRIKKTLDQEQTNLIKNYEQLKLAMGRFVRSQRAISDLKETIVGTETLIPLTSPCTSQRRRRRTINYY